MRLNERPSVKRPRATRHPNYSNDDLIVLAVLFLILFVGAYLGIWATR